MLVGKHSRNAGGQESGAAQSGLFLVKGTVSGEESNKQIDWKDTNAVPTKPFGEHDSSMQLIGSGGSGVKMKDGTLVFPLEGTKKKDDTGKDGKTVSLILYSKDTTDWTLSKGMSDDGCSDPSVVEWEVKLMMMTACGDGRRRVYESADKGNTWTEALGTLSRVWGSNQNEGEAKAVGSGFTTATTFGVDDKNVMLVTLPVYAKDNNRNAGGQESGAAQSGLFLVKGTVSGEESNKQIDWKDTNAVPTKPFGEHDSSMQLIGSGGSGVKMKDGTLVFPLEGTKKKDDTGKDGKTVSLILYSKDTTDWTLSKGMSDDGCSDPSVVEWEVKLMMMTACGDGRRRVYESADKGNTWTEALGTLSRVWGSNQNEGEAKAVG
ncbi:trans-sialidase, putative, partial [Trypanosoma cruzi]